MKSPATNALVENCTAKQGNGLVVGTSSGANFSNTTFRNCTAKGTAFGCHIKFKDEQTGFVDGVVFEDIIIESPKLYAIGINQNGQSQTSPGELGSNVRISNVLFKSIRGSGVAVGGRFTCNSGALACRNISLVDVHLNAVLGCKSTNVFGEGQVVSPAPCTPPSIVNAA
jgi:hypothetical protein